MRFIPAAALLAIAGFAQPAVAQGPDTATTGAHSEGRQQNGAVQAGAGSKGDVTTGSSGPENGGSDPVQPLDPGFDIRPSAHPFLGPVALEIRRRGPLRCDLIADDAPRKRCEASQAKGDAND